jgi:hypothetical protein
MEVIHVERPFEKVGIDVLGPFPATTGGNVNVIVAVDYLTKWAETKALRSATARDAAEFFVEDIVLRHGAPESVVTDCGKCFVAEFTKGGHAFDGSRPQNDHTVPPTSQWSR